MQLEDYNSTAQTKTESIEESAERQFTRWIILASGEGAGRVASLYFTKMKNEAIDNRILLMNTNRGTIPNSSDFQYFCSKIYENITLTW